MYLFVFGSLFLHSGWAVSLEDFIYWLAASIYIFRKMYDTTYGSIRWFCVWDAVRSGGRDMQGIRKIVKLCAERCGKKEKRKNRAEKQGKKIENKS